MCSQLLDMKNSYKTLDGDRQRKESNGSPIRKWEDDCKMDLRETGRSELDWDELRQDRIQWRTFVNAVMNVLVP